jgi:hypothetical protein
MDRGDAWVANNDDAGRSQQEEAESLKRSDWKGNVSSQGVPKRSKNDAIDRYGPMMAKGKAQSRAARKPNIQSDKSIYTERRGSRGVCRETDEKARRELISDDEVMAKSRALNDKTTTRSDDEEAGANDEETT